MGIFIVHDTRQTLRSQKWTANAEALRLLSGEDPRRTPDLGEELRKTSAFTVHLPPDATE